MPPEVTVELLQAEIVHLRHVMEDPLFKNAHGILGRTLIPGLLHPGRKNDRVVVFCPLGVVRVQLGSIQSRLAMIACMQLSQTTSARTPPKYFRALLLTAIH